MEPLLHSLGLALVVFLSCLEVRRQERELVGRVRASEPDGEPRCPYCHDPFAWDDEEERVHVRCASCGTEHHAGCWAEHAECSVFGCGSRDLRETETSESEVGERMSESEVGERMSESEVGERMSESEDGERTTESEDGERTTESESELESESESESEAASAPALASPHG